MKKNRLQLAAAMSAAILGCGLHAPAQATDTVVEQTTIMTACKLFSIDSNAGLLTASQRVQKIQVRLDNALVAARDLSPSAVRIKIVGGNPVVTLDNYMIATADGNSATRNSMTQLELAQKWADSLRMCLSDSGAITRYISMLTGKYPAAARIASLASRDDIVILNPETLLPLKLLTPISAESSKFGDAVEAVVSTDVPLRPFFDSYLPAGTLVIGEIVSASKYTNNNYAGKDAFTVNFYKLRTPNGEEVPIAAHILGGLNEWTMINARPVNAVSCLDGPAHSAGMHSDMKEVGLPSKGYIVGAWKGSSVNELREDNYPRMIIDRNTVTAIAPGEPLLLKFTASTAMAIAGKRQLISVVTTSQ
jgi:hypothetical protein